MLIRSRWRDMQTYVMRSAWSERWRKQSTFDQQPAFSHQEVILNLFGLVCKELNQEMFTRWDTCSKRDNMCRNSFLHIFLQNWWPSSGSDQISGGTKQNMEQVWRGIFIWWKVPVCLFFLLGQWCLTTGTKLNCYYSHCWWCCSREICKNFDEMAGRLGEIPDETKELVELQRLNIDQPYWFANTSLLFYFSKDFVSVGAIVHPHTIVIWSATIFSPILHHFHLTF